PQLPVLWFFLFSSTSSFCVPSCLFSGSSCSPPPPLSVSPVACSLVLLVLLHLLFLCPQLPVLWFFLFSSTSSFCVPSCLFSGSSPSPLSSKQRSHVSYSHTFFLLFFPTMNSSSSSFLLPHFLPNHSFPISFPLPVHFSYFSLSYFPPSLPTYPLSFPHLFFNFSCFFLFFLFFFI
ncbi:hypothetical protein OTU49_001172, partial [Cherax quadricarinatus]